VRIVIGHQSLVIGKDFRSVYLSEAVDKQDAASVIVDVADEATECCGICVQLPLMRLALGLKTHLSVTTRCFVKLKKDLVMNNVL
jgi:hypothetical protein